MKYRQTDRNGSKLPGISQSVSLDVWRRVSERVGLLTFDPGDDDASRAEDVHGVEALVFADDGLQDAEQLAQALVDRLVEAVLVLCREGTWCYRADHTATL